MNVAQLVRDVSLSDQPMVEKVIQHITDLRDRDEKSWYASLLTRRLAGAGLFDLAFTTADLTETFYEKMEALLSIASQLIQVGYPQRAVPILLQMELEARETTDPTATIWQKAETLGKIARLRNAMGDSEHALRLWRGAIEMAVPGQDIDADCPAVLSEICKDVALAGMLDLARQTADLIVASGRRDAALEAIAKLESDRS